MNEVITHSNDELLMPAEVAETLRINVLTVYSYIRRGDLNAIRLGRTYRITRDDLTRFLESKKVTQSFNNNNINNWKES